MIPTSLSPVHAGIYFHVPFCLQKCRYCDFYSITDLDEIKAYLSAVTSELTIGHIPRASVDSIYIGGGTPSLLGPKGIGHLLDRVAAVFSVTSHAEVSMEANPGTLSAEDLEGYRLAGVNRLTLGVQSFSDSGLRFLGRIHSAAEAARAITLSRVAGFDNLGIDLIYGLPDQTPGDWAADLHTALSFAPEHFSCYMLTVEPGTPLGEDVNCHRFRPLADDRIATMFRQTRHLLAAAGYRHYEISNFASDETTISRHNRKYWNGAPYIGFGPSAHSYRPPLRRWNVADVKAYIQRIGEGRSPVAGEEILSREQSIMEAVLLGLRQMDGIAIDEFDAAFDTDFRALFAPVLQSPMMQGRLTVEDNCCRLTESGMVVMDSVVGRMIDCISR
jgi:oxygen-independent coproporphyrinogen-3 oxidase